MHMHAVASYVLVEEALHSQDGHVVAAAGIHFGGELAAQLLHLVATVHSLLHELLVVQPTTAMQSIKSC